MSIKEVAAACGVGIATVSRSLNGDAEVAPATRERVQATARAMGYRPLAAARGLVRGRTGNIAVAVTAPHTPVFLNPFYAEVLGGLEGELERADLHLLITSLKRGQDLVQLAAEGRADGLIVVGCEVEVEVLETIRAMTPLVLIDRALPGFTSVSTDNRRGAAGVTRQLLERGRRQLAFVSDDTANPNFRARHEGFCDALLEAGLDPVVAPVASRSPALGGGRAATAELLEHFRPDGLVCANDTTALGAMRALAEAGLKVPDDVGVVGFDGLAEAAHAEPALETAWVDRERMGREGARLLLEAIERPGGEARAVLLPAEPRPGRSI